MTNDATPSSTEDDPAPGPLAFWRWWGRAVVDRRSAFRCPTVATLDADGWPVARTVVLRGADAPTRGLRFHTDQRSAKAAQLRADPRLCWHFYDKKRKLQLRAWATATLHPSGPIAEAGWDQCSDFGRRTYCVSPGPGTPQPEPTSGLPAHLERGDLTPDDRASGRAQFLAVQTVVHRIDWLWLHHAGHRRRRFDWSSGAWRAQWLVP